MVTALSTSSGLVGEICRLTIWHSKWHQLKGHWIDEIIELAEWSENSHRVVLIVQESILWRSGCLFDVFFRGPVDQWMLNRSGKTMLSRGKSGWSCWLSVYRDLDRKHAVQQSLYTALEEVGAFNLPPDSKPHFLCDTFRDLQPYNSVLFRATCGWTARPNPVKKWPTLTVWFGIAGCQLLPYLEIPVPSYAWRQHIFWQRSLSLCLSLSISLFSLSLSLSLPLLACCATVFASESDLCKARIVYIIRRQRQKMDTYTQYLYNICRFSNKGQCFGALLSLREEREDFTSDPATSGCWGWLIWLTRVQNNQSSESSRQMSTGKGILSSAQLC